MLPSSWLTAKVGVKSTLVIGLCFLGATSVAFGAASTVFLLDLARLGQGMGAALSLAGALGWLVSRASSLRRGELLGVAMAAGALGSVFGPAFGALATVTGISYVFAGIALMAFLLSAFAASLAGPAHDRRVAPSGVLSALRRADIRKVLWLLALPSLMFGVLGVVAPLQLAALGLSGAAIGFVLVFAAGIQTATTVGIGRWADRAGRAAPLRASLIASFLVCLAMPVSTLSVWALLICIVVACTAFGGFFPPAMALLADHADAAAFSYGLLFSLMNLGWAPAQFCGSIGGGVLAGAFGYSIPYLLLAVACLLTLVTQRRWLNDSQHVTIPSGFASSHLKSP
jgi:MFS family permease